MSLLSDARSMQSKWTGPSVLNEAAVAALSLDGCGETYGDVSDCGEAYIVFATLPRKRGGAAIVRETDQGFVYVTMYEEHERDTTFAAAVAECEAYEDMLNARYELETGECITIEQDHADTWCAYYMRKEVATADTFTSLFAELRDWCERENYWPNVYSVNDHGNVDVHSLDTGAVVASYV